MAEKCECGFKIRDTGHYPIICSCGRRYGEASAPIVAGYRDERRRICEACPENANGICLDCKRAFPNRLCRIDVAIANPRIRCKRNHWLAVRLNCPRCGLLLQKPSGVDHCPTCGWRGKGVQQLRSPLASRIAPAASVNGR